MAKDNELVVENAFKEEIGMNIDEAIDILDNEGITPDDLGEITNKFKNLITEEVDRRKIPYEYRFLMLNVIFYTMFRTTAEFHRKFVETIKNN